MYRRNFVGGWNKSHGQVEQTARIDSFDLASLGTWGEILLGGRYLEIYQEDGFCELFPPGCAEGQVVGLSRKANGFGGHQAFFLCPQCGQRVRFLYLAGGRGVLCRTCAKLNYRSQQQTKDSMVYFVKGTEYAQRQLSPPPRRLDGVTFCGWLPDRPRYMHHATYQKRLARFLRYRRRHEARLLSDLLGLIGPEEWAKFKGELGDKK